MLARTYTQKPSIAAPSVRNKSAALERPDLPEVPLDVLETDPERGLPNGLISPVVPVEYAPTTVTRRRTNQHKPRLPHEHANPTQDPASNNAICQPTAAVGFSTSMQAGRRWIYSTFKAPWSSDTPRDRLKAIARRRPVCGSGRNRAASINGCANSSREKSRHRLPSRDNET